MIDIKDAKQEVKKRFAEQNLKVSQKSSRGQKYYEVRSQKDNRYLASFKADSWHSLNKDVKSGRIGIKTQKGRSFASGEQQWAISQDVKGKKSGQITKAQRGYLAYVQERWLFSKGRSGIEGNRRVLKGGTSKLMTIQNASDLEKAKTQAYYSAKTGLYFTPDHEELLESRIVRTSYRSQGMSKKWAKTKTR